MLHEQEQQLGRRILPGVKQVHEEAMQRTQELQPREDCWQPLQKEDLDWKRGAAGKPQIGVAEETVLNAEHELVE